MTPTHAGGVVTDRRREGAVFLLVRASRPPFDWVLPKGHIEEGETPEEAAQREVREESGVTADIVRLVGDSTFDVRGAPVRVRYFLMQFREQGTAEERRETRWCSLEDAERLLKFESTRDIVRIAAAQHDG
jgi:8-oxo-dGTP pyrophosphatase MutT (NUDIX family)